MGFPKKIEAVGVKFHESKNENMELVFENFSYSIADTLNRITSGESSHFNTNYDGLLILIDEADSATDELDLGAFTKLLTERLQKEGTETMMFGIAGLPKTKEVLNKSHPSSLRIFDDIVIDRLTNQEIKQVISKVLQSGKELNGVPITIEPSAEALLVLFSEGFPHFIHQYGFNAYELSDGVNISHENVVSGAFGKNGALETIGNKYYKDDYYNKIQRDNYRQVLNIMAESMDGWVTRQQIIKKYKGTEQTLSNAINALTKRNIIVPQEGKKWVYRLQDKGFAWWILMNCKKDEQKQAEQNSKKSRTDVK